MWLFTKYGFYSAVCPRQGPDRRAPVDPDRIMVRARVRDHLVNLMEAFPILAAEIEEHTGTDYAYRLHTDKRNWAKVVASLATSRSADRATTTCNGPSPTAASTTVWRTRSPTWPSTGWRRPRLGRSRSGDSEPDFPRS